MERERERGRRGRRKRHCHDRKEEGGSSCSLPGDNCDVSMAL